MRVATDSVWQFMWQVTTHVVVSYLLLVHILQQETPRYVPHIPRLPTTYYPLPPSIHPASQSCCHPASWPSLPANQQNQLSNPNQPAKQKRSPKPNLPRAIQHATTRNLPVRGGQIAFRPLLLSIRMRKLITKLISTVVCPVHILVIFHAIRFVCLRAFIVDPRFSAENKLSNVKRQAGAGA